MSSHWTTRSSEDFVYRISSDFALQIEKKMDALGLSQSKLARNLGVTDGRVSQVLRNPGNLTLKNMVEYARSLGMKVSVVAYEDGDPQNNNGPINSEIFSMCWAKSGKPKTFSAVSQTFVRLPNTAPIRYVGNYKVSESRISGADADVITNLLAMEAMNTTSGSVVSMGVK